MLVDSHTHLYLEQFDEDRAAVIQRALEAGVTHMMLPNIDQSTMSAMHDLAQAYPANCHAMMGLHPCSVKANYKEELDAVYHALHLPQGTTYVAVGEMGLDFYWDKTFVKEQEEAFLQQMEWALALNLPIVIHTRDSMDRGIELVRSMQNGQLRGVFHCFGGSKEQAKAIMDIGLLMGIGGVATFKNGGLDKVLPYIPLDHLILETDAPYLTPVPHRGQRNESAYIPLVAQRVSKIKEVSLSEVAEVTSQTALKLFGISSSIA